MSDTTNPAATPGPVRALERANRVRRERAVLKTRVAEGHLAAAEIILTCPSAVARMPIAHLLCTQRGWGDARCRAFLAQVPLPEQKPIGSLTERQRRAVASLLTARECRARTDRISS